MATNSPTRSTVRVRATTSTERKNGEKRERERASNEIVKNTRPWRTRARYRPLSYGASRARDNRTPCTTAVAGARPRSRSPSHDRRPGIAAGVSNGSAGPRTEFAHRTQRPGNVRTRRRTMPSEIRNRPSRFDTTDGSDGCCARSNSMDERGKRHAFILVFPAGSTREHIQESFLECACTAVARRPNNPAIHENGNGRPPWSGKINGDHDLSERSIILRCVWPVRSHCTSRRGSVVSKRRFIYIFPMKYNVYIHMYTHAHTYG